MEVKKVRLKRWIAGFLCFCLLATSDVFVSQAAAIGSQGQAIPESGTEENSGENAKNAENEEEEQTNVESQKPLLEYAVVDQPYVECPGTQNVVLGIQAGKGKIEQAVLQYRNQTTGEVLIADAQEILEDAVLFSMSFERQEQIGIYELLSVRYTVNGTEYQSDFSEIGMEAVFGVGMETASDPDGIVEEDIDVDVDVVTIDEDGKTTSKNTIKEAIAEVQEVSGEIQFKAKNYGAAKNVVVVLDPGHDANHVGTVGNGLVEKDLNLKIAQYCKAELETYAGVTVYMTRSGDACPFGTSDASTCNLKRVEYAKKVGANIYVSIHNNAGGGNGSEIYYPNANYNPSVSAVGKDVAQKILNNLVKLGLKNRGIRIRNSENGTTYADGSPADYYAVIKNCKTQGIPAIIVEHAFVDSSDAANFLNSDAKLKKLGVADATGIAQYFNLKKKGEAPEEDEETNLTVPVITSAKSASNTAIKLSWGSMEDVSSYIIMRSTKKESGYKQLATVGGTVTSYTDKTVKARTDYYYKIAAVIGNEQSDYSAAKRGKTVVNPNIKFVKSVGTNQLKITWNKKAGSNGYYIYRSTSAKKGFKKIATIEDGSTLSYTDSGVTKGQVYYYKIKTRNKIEGSVGCSTASSAAYGKTVGKTKILSLTIPNTKSIELSWKKVKDSNGYFLYRSESPNSGFKRIATLSGNYQTTYRDSDVKAGVLYYYKVRARNKFNGKTGYSSYSKVVSGAIVKTPKIKSVVSQSPTKLEISWNKANGANGYYIYRSTSPSSGFKRVGVVSNGSRTSYISEGQKTGQTYYFKIKARSKVNGKNKASSASKAAEGRTVGRTTMVSCMFNSGKVSVNWTPVEGASGYTVAKSETADGTYTQIGEVNSGTTTSYSDSQAEAGKTYYYKVQTLNTVGGKTGYSGYCDPMSVSVGTAIMGASAVTVNQMTTYYNRSGKKYPSAVYEDKGAANIDAFCNIVMQEAAAEGVRADVVFAQICNETGFLQFGGDVSADQCNFAGLGATGGGVAGETFSDVRTGIRAQVQHLKAYACKDPLNQKCVDSRFSYVERGTAPFVEWLGIQENPYGKGWATAKNYGYTLMNIVRTMQTM